MPFSEFYGLGLIPYGLGLIPEQKWLLFVSNSQLKSKNNFDRMKSERFAMNFFVELVSID